MTIDNQGFDIHETEHGPRFAAETWMHQYRLEVVTAYDALSDRWAFHVYIYNAAGVREALSHKPTIFYAASKREAIEDGMARARMRVQHLRGPQPMR